MLATYEGCGTYYLSYAAARSDQRIGGHIRCGQLPHTNALLCSADENNGSGFAAELKERSACQVTDSALEIDSLRQSGHSGDKLAIAGSPDD